MNSIYLVGFMGSGKSTIGEKLAERLGLKFMDTDIQIEKQTMKKITDIFADQGEDGFREIEHQILIATRTKDYIIATGGGIIEREDNRAWLANQHVVYLKTSWETINRRLVNDDSRPIWQDQSRDKKQLLTERDRKYTQVANQVIETDLLTEDKIVEQIVSFLNNK